MSLSPDDGAELEHWFVDYLVTNIGCSPDRIDLDAPLNELGVGSSDAVVMSGELSELLGRPVSPVDFWQNPTINTLVQALVNPASEPAPGMAAGAEPGSFNEPIAVIGLGCRLPGDIHGPEDLWQFLAERRSAVGTVPAERWQPFDDGSPEVAAALARTTRWGSFLSGVDAFDAEFFDISPSEAAKIDPQQRLLLEVAVEALDHAGIPAESLQRTQTGVFAGACLGEYGYLASRDLSQIDAWTGTGGALSIIANRLSYFLDLRGPSVAVDTACSSSLVAVHLAMRSLRTGETDLAIAAGVNLVLSPAVTRSFDQAEAMSRSGACRAFDAGADGFVRGEGCGVAVLKRLSDAVRDGDRVLAVVRGSAVNQDGRSNGLMAPNPAAQTAVLRAACADAGVAPGEVDYVEAHGTGTLLGDPIEARALGSVYGRAHPPGSALLIGAVKTNIGHLEAAAGITGFIKATLAVQRGEIPPNLHFETPNPHIPFDELRLEVVDRVTRWPSTGRPRRAGVSSFGFGGTNAHVVLEQAPTPAPVPIAEVEPDAAVTTLVVSGKTAQRVARWAQTLADWMDGPGAGVALTDIAHTLNHHRGAQASFATVAADTREAALLGLRALASGQPAVGVVAPHRGPCAPGRVFVYSGQGSQWAGMGQRLLADEQAFAAAVAELEPDFVAQVGFSLWQVLADGAPVVGIERIQPVLVGMQLALTALWRSYGVTPDAVIGHSMGEVTAAVVSGALSAADGLRVIATRSRLMARLSGRGAMALVELAPHAAEELVADDPELTVAVYASPRQSVLAGPPHRIEAVITALQAADRLARLVDVDVASHHPTIDPVLPDLRAALADLTPSIPIVPVITTTWGPDGIPTFDADYWADNLRQPVMFTQAVTAAAARHATFIEVSPHPLLTSAITDTVAPAHHHSIPSVQRGDNEVRSFHTNLNAAHTTHPPQLPHPPEPHPLLPATPWLHKRHWLPEPRRSAASASAPRAGTLLGERITISATAPAQLWQARLTPETQPYPGPHRVHGVDVVPASVLCQTVLAAAAQAGARAVSDIRFRQPVMVDQRRFIQVVTDGDQVSVSSSATADAPPNRWVRHVDARIAPAGPAPDLLSVAPPTPGDGAHQTPSVSALLAERGIEGPPFDWSIESSGSTPAGLVVAVRLADVSAVALLDAALHVAPLAGAADVRAMVPAGAGEIVLGIEPTGPQVWLVIERAAGGGDDIVVDVTATMADGTPCLRVRGLRYVAIDGAPTSVGVDDADPRRFAHQIDWRPQPDDSVPVLTDTDTGTVAVVGRDGAANERLRQRLAGAGHPAAPVTAARYVVYLAGAEPTAAGSDLDGATRLSAEVIALVQQLAARPPVTLWILTRGVQEAVDAAALRQSCLWGLAGVIAAEHPEIWGGLVDLPAGSDAGDCGPALSGLLATSSASVLLLRDGVVLAPALSAVHGEPVRPALRCRPDAAYLITGGLGDLGLLTADWLADRGARRLLLAGRTALPPRRQWDAVADSATRAKVAAIRALEMRGVTVEAVALDVAVPGGVQALLQRRDRDGAAPIRGVIHTAGVTDGRLLSDVDAAALRDVLAPKVGGAQALHEAFPPESVDFFFLTASAATVFGVPGQGPYAAANAYLDALARSRRGHALSIDWVAWRGLGFGADAPIVAAELARLGSRPLSAGEAFTAWEYLATLDIAQAVVIPVAAEPDAGRSAELDPRPALPARDWSRLPAAEVNREFENGLRAILARELLIAESAVELDVPFAELGLNSMAAMSIRREAEQLVGIELSATMLWNHPTISALAAYLTDRVVPQQDSADDAAAAADDPEPGIGLLEGLFDSVEAGALNGEDGL